MYKCSDLDQIVSVRFSVALSDDCCNFDNMCVPGLPGTIQILLLCCIALLWHHLMWAVWFTLHLACGEKWETENEAVRVETQLWGERGMWAGGGVESGAD